MVGLGAGTLGHDAALVVAPDVVAGLDDDGGWLRVEHGDERRVARSLLGLADGERLLVAGRAAGAGLGRVRVRVFRAHALLHPVDGVRREASVAAVALLLAADELLLGQIEELAGGDAVCGFDGADGGEGPARAARALVLDGRVALGGGPVLLALQRLDGRERRGVGEVLTRERLLHRLLELVVREQRELVERTELGVGVQARRLVRGLHGVVEALELVVGVAVHIDGLGGGWEEAVRLGDRTVQGLPLGEHVLDIGLLSWTEGGERSASCECGGCDSRGKEEAGFHLGL